MAKERSIWNPGGRPLSLMAVDAEDLQVMSAMLQDAVLAVRDMTWHAGQRRFAMLSNRFRWEAGNFGARRKRIAERTRSLLVADGVLGVSSRGIDLSERDRVLSLLAIEFEEGEKPGGVLVARMAGDGAVRLDVECLDVTLRDVTRPYSAPSGSVPVHDLA